MKKEELFYLGKIIKTKGLKGEVKAYLDVDNPKEYHQLEAVFLEKKQDLIPYIIEKIFTEQNIATIKFKDIESIEEAEKLINCLLYLPLEMLPRLKGNKFYYHEITGFTVIDVIHGNIGIIKGVLDLPNNILFQVDRDGTEILIPLNDDVIQKVDRKKKTILIKAPEGLLEIYDI